MLTTLLMTTTVLAAAPAPGTGGSPARPAPQHVLAAGRWDPAIRAGLEKMILDYGRGSPGYDPAHKPVATFDWDNTSIKGDIEESFMEVLDAEDGKGRIAEYERMCEQDGKVKGYTWAAYVVAGMTDLQAREKTLQVIDQYTAAGKITMRPEMRDLVSAMQRYGWDVYAVSASAEPLVVTFAQFYGIPADHVVGIKLKKDANGVLQPELDGPLTYRAGKVEAIDKYIGVHPTFAAGDTDTDIEMLQSAKHALLMDRGNAEAKAAAQKGGWWVQSPGW